MAADSLHLLSNSAGALLENEFENEQFFQLDEEMNSMGILTSGGLDKPMPKQDDPDEFVPLPPDKKYHLFVSYSSEDREDAIKICDHMEERFHMKCMNFERDFVPGKHIDDNIADEMRRSVKVLIILSPNYTKSHWCVQEAREACELSFTDFSNLNVIPLLLRPLDDKLPPFLKSLVYIDAQRELDVPAKIYEAFMHSGSIDPLFKNNIERALYADNGAFLCQKFASRASFWDHGFAYRFPPLEDHEKEKFASFDLDPIECAKHYGLLTMDLNDRVLIRNYPLLVSKWRFLLLCVMFLAIACFIVGLYFLGIKPGDQEEEVPFLIAFVGGCLLVLICPCSLCFMCICRRSLSSSIHPVLLRLNTEFYTTSKCLMFFDDSTVSKPSLNIFKYDASDCRKYIFLLLKKMKPSLSEEEVKKTTDDLFKSKLKDLQLTNGLINWTSLPESASKRHNTRNYRACLCEMVEDILNSERKDANREIIEV